MAHLPRKGSCDSLEIASRSSSDSIGSGDTSTHNSMSSIPSSMATVSTHNSGDASPPVSSFAPLTKSTKPKKFSLNLNGSVSQGSTPLTPISPDFPITLDSPEKPGSSGVHMGDQYVNKERLAEDLCALSSMPELCDVTFLVGTDRQPICGVRAILAARSRVFRKMLYTDTAAVVGASKRVKKRQQVYRPADGYIEKYDFRGQPTVIVRDCEPEVFKQLIDYTHTGGVVLQARTLLGLMNASDHYSLEDLKQACIRFMERCIAVESVCSLLRSAEKYIQYKSTKILVQKIFEFVDASAEAILPLREFRTLPQHVVRIVLSREELQVSEMAKFEAAYTWCLNNCYDASDSAEIKTLFEPFVDVIDYHGIPAKHLMQRVKPAGVVDDAHILTALAYQADPSSIPDDSKPVPTRVRRVMTPLEGGSRAAPVSRFRRVQSSGTTLVSAPNQRRSSEHSSPKRDVRAGSVPLNSVDSASNLHDGYLRGSEVHPLRAHDVKDRIDSQSSSHASILSTPPLSPTHSPSTTSYQGSIMSASSSDSVPILSQDTIGSGSSGAGSGGSGGPNILQTQSNHGNKMTYNPLALDAIVNLSSTNAVEV